MIIQKDLHGNIIREYSNKSEAAKTLGLNESSVRKGIKYDRVVLGKFKFSILDSVNTNTAPVLQVPAKILLLDIETSPLLAYVFQKQVWKARIGYDKVLSDYFMLTWAAKWLGETEMLSDKLTSDEVLYENDERIVISLWKLLDEADIVIAHNALSFDIPNINTRSIKHNLSPPSPFKIIDTLKVAQGQFGFTHNSLDALAGFFGIPGKSFTNFDLWRKCVFGDKGALQEMELYNRQDVVVLESVYLKLRPYIKGHPNLDLYIDEDESVCPSCGSLHINKIKDNYFYTQAVRYDSYRCKDCGSISRSKTGVKYINKKKISAIPR